MWDIKAMTVHYPYFKNISGGLEWPNRWDKLLGPAHAAFSMRVAFLKSLLCPIVVTAPHDLLHVDFTSIETTLELNQLPRVTNVLVFQDHFTKHVLAYVTPDQTGKTIAKFLYGGYIYISGALARHLSNRGVSFTCSIIEEPCKILGVKWLQTTPYHPQTNGLVETSHQMIMHMTGRLGEERKLTGHLIWLKYCMPPDLQSPGTVHTIWCLDDGLGSWSTLSSPLLAAIRPPWESPLLSMWMCMWPQYGIDWGLSCRRHKPNQLQKHTDRNSTMTEK